MRIKNRLAPYLLLGLGACEQKINAPRIPLNLSASVRTLDGFPLPALIEERPGVAAYLTEYTVTLTADGFWRGKGTRYPEGTSSSTASELWDNGTYRYDGKTLLLHSNFSHADFVSTIEGDTITSTMLLPIADATHFLVMW